MKTRRSPRLHKRRNHFRQGNPVKSHFVGQPKKQGIRITARDSVFIDGKLIKIKDIQSGQTKLHYAGGETKTIYVTPLGYAGLSELMIV